MDWNLLARKAGTQLGWLLILSVLYVFLRSHGLAAVMGPEAEGITVLIQLVGDIYAVLLAFTIFVIWSQFTDLENAVMRESDSLDDLLRFSEYSDAEARAAIRRAMANYVHQVLRSEWQALGDAKKDKQAEDFFARFVKSVVEADLKGESDQFLYARMFDMLQRTSGYRDERVAKSLTRIPPTLSGLVQLIAGMLLLLVFVYPFHHIVAGVVCLNLVAVVLWLANFVMTDTDNPLKGVWNVSPKPFAELKL